MIERDTKVLVHMANPQGSELIELLNSLGGEVLCTYPINLVKPICYLVAFSHTHMDKIQQAADNDSGGNNIVHLTTVNRNTILDRPSDYRYFHLAAFDEVTPA